jgi:hypothetical protein
MASRGRQPPDFRPNGELTRFNCNEGFHKASPSFVVLPSGVLPHAIFDVVIEDEIQFFVAEAIVLGQNAVDFVEDRFGFAGVKLLKLAVFPDSSDRMRFVIGHQAIKCDSKFAPEITSKDTYWETLHVGSCYVSLVA